MIIESLRLLKADIWEQNKDKISKIDFDLKMHQIYSICDRIEKEVVIRDLLKYENKD